MFLVIARMIVVRADVLLGTGRIIVESFPAVVVDATAAAAAAAAVVVVFIIADAGVFWTYFGPRRDFAGELHNQLRIVERSFFAK